MKKQYVIIPQIDINIFKDITFNKGIRYYVIFEDNMLFYTYKEKTYKTDYNIHNNKSNDIILFKYAEVPYQKQYLKYGDTVKLNSYYALQQGKSKTSNIVEQHFVFAYWDKRNENCAVLVNSKQKKIKYDYRFIEKIENKNLHDSFEKTLYIFNLTDCNIYTVKGEYYNETYTININNEKIIIEQGIINKGKIKTYRNYCLLVYDNIESLNKKLIKIQENVNKAVKSLIINELYC